jgi:hypothetical protein
VLAEIGAICSAMEECYELMLGYAAQGLPTDEGSEAGAPIRVCLARAADTLTRLLASVETCAEIAEGGDALPFLTVLERDAHASLAAIELVLAQSSISSQLIDNLNASTHVRAMLTDLFLVAEIAAASRVRALPVISSEGMR